MTTIAPAPPSDTWVTGALVEYANGIHAEVVAVDGEFCVLRAMVDGRYAVAWGEPDEFSFPFEGEGEFVDTLEIALADVARAKAGETS